MIFGASQMLFGANEFDGINETVSSLDAAAKTNIGVFGRWLLTLLPFGVGIISSWKAYSDESKKADNDKDSRKLAAVAIIWFVIGTAAAILVISLFGKVFMGNSSLAIQVMQTQFRSIFGV